MGDDDEQFLDSLLAAPGEPDQTAGRILDAALARFAADGIRKTTMNQIADAARLGVATVYRRFPQKHRLVQAALLRDVRGLIADIEAAMVGVDSMEEQLAAGFAAFVQGVSARPLTFTAVRGDREIGIPILADRAILELGRAYIAGTLRSWRERGALGELDPELVAEIFARLAHSLILTPGGRIPVGDTAATRQFARTYLLPLVRPRGD